RGDFPGGIFWLRASGAPVEALISLAPILREVAPEPIRRHVPVDLTDANAYAELVRVALGQAPAPLLLVLDELTEPAWASFLPTGEVGVPAPPRDSGLAVGGQLSLDGLTHEAVLELARQTAGVPAGSDENAAMARVIDALEGLPLAIE